MQYVVMQYWINAGVRLQNIWEYFRQIFVVCSNTDLYLSTQLTVIAGATTDGHWER